MEQDSRNPLSQKIGQLHLTLLFGLVSNVVWVVVFLWFVLSNPPLPDIITIDRTVLKAIAAYALVWLIVGVFQGWILVFRVSKAKEVVLKGRARDGVLLGQSWGLFPLMPVCIVSEDSKDGKEQYLAVIPLDGNKMIHGLINPKSLLNDSADLQVYSDPGTRNPLCLVGKEQAFVVCWSVPKWSSLRKING